MQHMRYIDTRGLAPSVGFDKVLLAGTAPGGGLYMPETYPKIDIEAILKMTYAELATYILWFFVSGVIPREVLSKIAHEVYTEANFGTKEITPIEWLEQTLGILQLSNGETRAFKDLAMKIVARMIDYLLGQLGRHATVVVSTSGDTGGAAVAAFAFCKNVDLVVLYPDGRVSMRQRLLMTTSQAPNVHALAVKGTFDDCQQMTKELFADQPFSEQFGLTAVNSINWARIMAQMVYWVSCGAQVLGRGWKGFDVSVPTGNFGDVFSLYGTGEMGMPVRRIIVATNQNDVIDRAFKTGIYEKGKVHPSSSPSMDIQVSSNFERLLFDRAGRDGKRIREIYAEFEKTGRCDVGDLLRGLEDKWKSGSASEALVKRTIRSCYENRGRIIETHTAAGLAVGLRYREEGVPLIFAETARPEKVPDAVEAAIPGLHVEIPEAWKRLEAITEVFEVIDADTEWVKRFIAYIH